EIELLPALPAAWKNGMIKGIKARGNFTVDIYWNEGKLVKAIIHSNVGGNCRIRTAMPVKIPGSYSTAAGNKNPNPLFTSYGKPPFKNSARETLQEVNKPAAFVIDFKTEKGRTYTIVPL
ncbi:MAG TPA: glycoside hydrolase family 95 protein, partial [Chitinophagaceae bacterium]